MKEILFFVVAAIFFLIAGGIWILTILHPPDEE